MYVILPVYIAEMSPKESRGMLTSIIGPMFSIGIVISLCANVGFAKFSFGWRMAFVVVLFGLLYVIGMKFMPHTPR